MGGFFVSIDTIYVLIREHLYGVSRIIIIVNIGFIEEMAENDIIRVFFKAIRENSGVIHSVSAGLNIAFLFVDYAIGINFYEPLINYHRSVVVN